MPCFLLSYRERPKYHIKEDGDTIKNGPTARGEISDTVKVTRNLRDETVRARWVRNCWSLVLCWLCGLTLVLICSDQGKTVKNAGWDFSVGSQGTGTVRSVAILKPPQAREKKPETPGRESSNQRFSASGNALHESREDYLLKDGRHSYGDELQESNPEDVSLPPPILFSITHVFVTICIRLRSCRNFHIINGLYRVEKRLVTMSSMFVILLISYLHN